LTRDANNELFGESSSPQFGLQRREKVRWKMNHFLILIWTTIRRFIVECDASAGTEYAILLALMVLAIVGAATVLGTSSTGLLRSAASDAANSTGGHLTGPSANALGAVVNAGSAP